MSLANIAHIYGFGAAQIFIHGFGIHICHPKLLAYKAQYNIFATVLQDIIMFLPLFPLQKRIFPPFAAKCAAAAMAADKSDIITERQQSILNRAH